MSRRAALAAARIEAMAITERVAVAWRVSVIALRGKSHAREFTVPRAVAMYLIRQHTALSLPQIARMFGGRHHTTAMHAIHSIEAHVRAGDDLARRIATLDLDLDQTEPMPPRATTMDVMEQVFAMRAEMREMQRRMTEALRDLRRMVA